MIHERRAGPIAWRMSAYAIAALLLSWTAIVNGYPLVFGDSGTYLATALDLRYPVDRPPVYGLAIAPFLLVAGPWAVVAAQGLLAAVLIGLALDVTDPPAGARVAAARLVIAAALLAGFSSLPWFTGQLMPDVATGLTCLALYVTLATGRRLAWVTAAPLALLIGCHLSHVLLVAVLLALAAPAIILIAGAREAARRCLPAPAALLVAVVAVSGMNLVARGRFVPSLSSDMFTLARLFDGRLAQPLLAARCRTRPLLLCTVRPIVDDPAEPKPGQQFLWHPRTPLWRLAEEHPDALRREEATIIRDTIRANPGAVATLAWHGWRDQLLTARTGILRPYGDGDSIVAKLAANRPGDLPAFRAARQQQAGLDALRIVPDRAIAVTLLLVAPLVAAWAWRRRRRRLAGLAALIVVTIVANAAITGALSGPDDRYQSRVLWLPLLLFIAAAWSAHGAANDPRR